MTYTKYWCSQPREKCSKTFLLYKQCKFLSNKKWISYLSAYFIYWVKYAFVSSFIMLLLCWSEYFCLHPCTYHPEGICDYIAEKSTNSRRDRVQLERVLVPTISLLEIDFSLFIQGEIYRMKKRYAEYRHWIAYKRKRCA